MGKLLCVGLVIAAFALGVYVGRLPIASLILGDAAPTPETSSAEEAPAASTNKAAGGTVIRTTSLSAGQQKLLSALGVDTSQIVITPAMIACAEAKVGSARLKEIEGGATPSFTEGLSLLACYR